MSTGERLQALTGWPDDPRAVAELLTRAELVVLGALRDASNLALLVRVGGEEGPLAVYKPVSTSPTGRSPPVRWRRGW